MFPLVMTFDFDLTFGSFLTIPLSGLHKVGIHGIQIRASFEKLGAILVTGP